MSDKNYDSNDSSIDDEWLTLKALQSYLHLSRTSFYRLIKSDESFPKGYNILSNKKLWKKLKNLERNKKNWKNLKNRKKLNN